MAGSTFGTLFRVTTAGESHGPGNVAIVDGCPPGLELSAADIQPDLDRRRPGQSALVTQRDEADRVQVLSGVFDGKTTGTPIALLIPNQDQRSRDYADIKDKYRPGHADYTFDAKFGFRDYRGGGRSSARETTARVAAAAVARKLLAERCGVRVLAFVTQVGEVTAAIPDPAAVTLEQVEATPVRCPDPAAAAAMIALIERVRSERDSIGGVAQVVGTGVPAGWGEPVFDKLKADLAKALFSLPAVLGVDYGVGFGCATLRGSQNNDVFEQTRRHEGGEQAGRHEGTKARRKESDEGAHAGEQAVGHDPSCLNASVPPRLLQTPTNRHGGMLGGISSGMPITLRCAVKPTSSIPQDQPTVTRTGEPTTISTKGRHDPCLLPRFVPMAEAMVLLVLADHYLRQRAIA